MSPLVLGEPDGVRLVLDPYGATWRRLDVPAAGGPRQVLLDETGPSGPDEVVLPGYRNVMVGRYANRIAAGRFDLDGTTYDVGRNDRGHHLHGGSGGFHDRTWVVEEHTEGAAVLRLSSPAGEAGYPGALDVRLGLEVRALTVRLTITATSDAPTLCNPTQHPYFRLGGPLAEHRLSVAADRYLPVDPLGIPLGEPRPVAGTPFDLRGDEPIGARVLDHDFWLTDPLAATLVSGDGRLALEVRTDRPGLQVFTEPGRRAVALETQLHPDSPHHPDWPSAVLRPGRTFRTTTSWTFSER